MNYIVPEMRPCLIGTEDGRWKRRAQVQKEIMKINAIASENLTAT